VFLHDLQVVRVPQALVLLLVVVDHRLEEGEAWGALDKLIAILLPAHQLAVEAREAQGEAAAAQGQREPLVGNLQCCGVGIGKGCSWRVDSFSWNWYWPSSCSAAL
jgi:hypothetical protein